jgi:cellulose biosynthesis protein BcsQ
MSVTSFTPRLPAKRIVLFNHKGGVGKTTLTASISSALARRGKRILLVDSDPQCNLTIFRVSEDVVNDLMDNSESLEGNTLWSSVKPMVDSTGDLKIISPIELDAGLYLLPGDIRLAEFESELNDFWNECYKRKVRGFRGTSALSEVINNVVQTYEIDFVFYDSGPNIGALNRAILLDCDYFIIPAACDLFSLSAIRTVGHTLAKWIEEWQMISGLAPDGLYLLPGRPKLLGYIPQRFRVRVGQPTKDYQKFFPQIENQVQSEVVTRLLAVDHSLVSNRHSLKLGEVKDYSSQASTSQVSGIPLQSDEIDGIAEKILERTTSG